MEEDLLEASGRVADNSVYAQYFKNNFERSGSPKGFDLESILSDPQNNISKIIQLSKYNYNKQGIIMRVINIIRDFGASGYEIKYHAQNSKAEKVIQDFIKRVSLDQVCKDILFELAQTGNVAGYNRDGKRIDIFPLNKIEVTPLIIDNNPVLYYINNNYMDAIGDDEFIQKKIKSSYPKEVAKAILTGKDKIVLNVENSFFVKINSSRYEPYGIPFILPAFDDIAHKTILKEAERSTATGIIERILKISIGDKDNKPKQASIDFYDNLINGKKGALKITVPYFVGAEWIEPSSDIFGQDKFAQVDSDILNALGVSLTLISGQGGGNYSEAFISIAGLIKTIEYIRSFVPNIINNWFEKELLKNGISVEYAPKFTFKSVEIDKASKMELVKWAFTTAGLPYQALYEECGYDYVNIKLQREIENEEKTEDIFKLRSQPFQGQQGDINPDDKGGRPTKTLDQRKTDKKQSNNDSPRPSTSK